MTAVASGAPGGHATPGAVPQGMPGAQPALGREVTVSVTSSATAGAVARVPAVAAAAGGAVRVDDGRPRIGSVKWITHIWSTPDRPKNHLPIGSIRFGTSIALKSREPVPGGGCPARWYAVEPLGYVCADETTTFDFDSAYWKALAELSPGPGALPYRYAFSTGAPMYSRVPTVEEQRNAELDLGPVRTFKPLGKWSEGHERLVSTAEGDAIQATAEVPEYFRDHRSIPGSPWNPKALAKVRTIPAGSGLAYVKAFAAAGRTWLLTPDLLLVPADRVFPYKPTAFHGVLLGKGGEGSGGGEGASLPAAWIRGALVKKLVRGGEGVFMAPGGGEAWATKTLVALTGKSALVGKVRHWESREGGWLAESEAVSVVQAAERLPRSIGADEKWIEARILPGTMVAYEGLRPVWTTLWSAGKGGVPVKGNDPKRFATTETGIFAFQWKDKVATMSPDKGAPSVFFFSDVPHIQYVHAPLALHVTYWHEDFGHLRSAECLNVSPLDGEWLFGWTLPALPEGWNSVRPSKLMGPATRIVIHGQ